MKQLFKHDTIVVAIAAYNEERHIAETIASLKNQDCGEFLALISDNASTDRTEEVCRQAIGGDSRFHYVRHSENRGGAVNGRWTLETTDSPYFMWLGAHDKITPDFLSGHIKALETSPECSLSYSLTQWIDEAGTPIGVTDPSCLGDLDGGPLARYFESVRCLKEGTAINNVLRRSMIGFGHAWNIPGADHIILSEMLFRGPAHRIGRPQYLRRAFGHRSADYMERLTGKGDVEFNKVAMIPAYLDNFDKLMSDRPIRYLIRPLFESLLERRMRQRFTTLDWFYIGVTRLIGL